MQVGKAVLFNRVTLPWESNPGPSPIREVIVMEVYDYRVSFFTGTPLNVSSLQ